MPYRPYLRREFDPETFPPAVLPLAEAVEDLIEHHINRLEKEAVRAEAAGNTVRAKDKRAQKSRYRIANITKRLGKSTFEELLKGRITRVPPRRDILALAMELACTRSETNHLINATIDWPQRRELFPPATPARLPVLRQIMENLQFPAYIIDADSRVERINQLCRRLWLIPEDGQPLLPEDITAPGPLIRFKTKGHVVENPPAVNLMKLCVSLEADLHPTIFALAPGDEVATAWFSAIGLISPVVPQRIEGAVFASEIPYSPEVARRMRTTPSYHPESRKQSGNHPASTFLSRLTLGVFDRRPPALRSQSRGARARQQEQEELDFAIQYVDTIYGTYNIQYRSDLMEESESRSEGAIRDEASDQAVSRDFLNAAGLHYVGPDRTLFRHVGAITSEPYISINDIAREFAIPFDEALHLLNSLHDANPNYAAFWAEPLGQVLRPLIRKRLTHDYDVLTEGYSFDGV